MARLTFQLRASQVNNKGDN